MKKQWDEMEKSIILKAILCAWVTLEIGLFIFSFVYSTALRTFDLLSAIPLVMALVSLAVFFLAKWAFTREMTGPGSEDDEK